MSAYTPPPFATQWDCSDCGAGAWLTDSEAQRGCVAPDCSGSMVQRPGVVRCCRLDEDECARRCTGRPGGCDTYGDGLESDGLLTVLAGRTVEDQPDGSVVVLLDLRGVAP